MQKSSETFPETSYEDWKKRAEKELSGPVTRTWEGTVIPFYFSGDDRLTEVSRFDNRIGAADVRTGSIRSWDNIAGFDQAPDKETNGHALEALMEGADGLLFRDAASYSPDTLLNDIMPDYAALLFENADLAFVNAYRQWLDHCDANHGSVRGYIRMDDSEGISDLFALFRDYPQIRFFHFHLDVAEEGQFSSQLADFLGHLANRIEAFTTEGITADALWQRLSVSVSCGPLFFEEIARLKAIRILVYKIFAAWGLRDIYPEDLLLHGISPPWINEAYQPHGNMLKECTCAMAMILGGCTQVTVMPEDEASELQRRVARNVSLILREESFFDKVNDPAAGSYYLENLTRTLAMNAWNSFTQSDTSS